MRASFFLGLGLLGAAVIAEACSVQSESTPPDNNIASFCADYAKALCQVSGACNFDAMACTTFQTSACTAQYSAQVTGTRTYNQPNGKACIDKLTTAYAGTSIDVPTLGDIATICNKVVIGNAQTNQACTSDNDCAGMMAVCTAYGAMNLCGPLTMKNKGDPCADPGDKCTGDTYCASQSSGAPTCVATPAIGQACTATIPCGASARCLGGTCAARAAQNAACATSDDCASGLYCDTYPPAVCTMGLAFARGSVDCTGILGTNEPDGGGMVIAQPEAGGTSSEGGDGGATSSEGGD